MKWTHKGHEYDAVYQHICQKKSFLIFGAGDYGHQFYPIMQKEIEIIGYIDNDEHKAGTKINGLPCLTFPDTKLVQDVGIVVTMSQIARVTAMEQLRNAGLMEGKDFFLMEEFISVYYAYRYGKVYFSSISFLPSTACNLNCRYCLNFNPFSEKFYVRELDKLIADVDLFFKCVDHIMLFHVSGGETFLYPHIADIVCYISEQYADRIDRLRMVTNGTIVPDDAILAKLAETNIEITVDDYREELPGSEQKFAQLLAKLQAYGIRHYTNRVDTWIDLAPDKTDYTSLSEEDLICHRSSCNQNWQELRDGKLYSCNYAAYAVVTGKLGQQDMEETYDLRCYTSDKAKELVEFRLGYTEKGYTNFCKYCRGFTPQNKTKVRPAEQAGARNLDFAYVQQRTEE